MLSLSVLRHLPEFDDQILAGRMQDRDGRLFNTLSDHFTGAYPDRTVIAVTGDGGFLFGGVELATAVQHGINLVIVVVNNSAYGNVFRDQKRLFDGRHAGSQLVNPDFQMYARSFGVPSWRVTDADGLRAALKQAIAANSPALVEVVTDIDNEPLPFAFLARGRA